MLQTFSILFTFITVSPTAQDKQKCFTQHFQNEPALTYVAPLTLYRKWGGRSFSWFPNLHCENHSLRDSCLSCQVSLLYMAHNLVWASLPQENKHKHNTGPLRVHRQPDFLIPLWSSGAGSAVLLVKLQEDRRSAKSTAGVCKSLEEPYEDCSSQIENGNMHPYFMYIHSVIFSMACL